MDLGNHKVVRQIVSRLKETAPGAGPVKVDGTWGSFAPMLAAYLSREMKRPILYVSAHIDDADNIADDLVVFLGRTPETFPVWEGQDKFSDATDEIAAQRLRVAVGLAHGAPGDLGDLVISTSIQAINQPVPSVQVLEAGGLKLAVNETIEPAIVVEWLHDAGFERVDRVDMPGQFARRGGIVDIFAPVTTEAGRTLGQTAVRDIEAVRVEFFGDAVESIRRINLDTQRSGEQIDSLNVIMPGGCQRLEQTELFINLLPADTIIILDEPTEVAEVSSLFLDRVDDPRRLYPFSAIYRAMQKFVLLEISRFADTATPEAMRLDVSSARHYEHKAGAVWKSGKAVLEELLAQTEEKEVILYCENNAEVNRVTEIICETHGSLPSNFHLPVGFIHQGFIVNSLNTIVVGHHEIFGQYAIRRRIRTIRSVSPVESLLDLQKGDYVVHINYGVGRFKGMRTMEKNGSAGEYLTIEYADKILIHVPVGSIALVQKFIGSTPKRPTLSRIGTKRWRRQKEKVAKGVQELAAQLLETQAKRKKLGGYAFGADSTWQKEFEESFLYQETPDQINVCEQIKADMKRTVPMDRLLCGDVGYGKTELAMRAAFKAVVAGKQVAVLVPTTVLCVQHGRTFAERFADFPVVIEVLNRFVAAKTAKEITTAARRGKVDILIGTHRLLSGDVGFKDLGLLIIDEEQRFGVEHKERLKKLKVNVDVLTMTATPIPRTLHLSLLGLRDISSLATPPLDRRAIVTKVCRYDRDLIRKAILHELNRDGQVFFLHNRVQTIERAADDVRKILADEKVRIDIAHGRMAKHELEDAMIRFVTGKTNVLVCSTIIESGLDIPNANTMIICDADRFGLAQLHQLRGRVGRYKHRAYAYMLLPARRSITPLAARRLKAIEEYSQLGAGFRIALRDLEIRGAGNILGAEQSGHINTVGYELYCRLLSEAVGRLKNEPVEEQAGALIDLGFSTCIPKSYIPSDRRRMEVYRKIAVAKDAGDLKKLSEELTDLFGPVPNQVARLLDLSELKILAGRWTIKSIIVSKPDVVFAFTDSAPAGDLFARAPGIVRIPDKRTVHLRLDKNYFQPQTLMAVLRKMLRK
ncbi:MAG: transcription-repair coupling factor [Planctomycetota bacterium]|nr:MAG: transcription-repair coupling factor [Planctomycetota bacterium]